MTYLFNCGVNEYSDAESTVDNNDIDDDCLYKDNNGDIYDKDGNIIDNAINDKNNNIIYPIYPLVLSMIQIFISKFFDYFNTK